MKIEKEMESLLKEILSILFDYPDYSYIFNTQFLEITRVCENKYIALYATYYNYQFFIDWKEDLDNNIINYLIRTNNYNKFNGPLRWNLKKGRNNKFIKMDSFNNMGSNEAMYYQVDNIISLIYPSDFYYQGLESLISIKLKIEYELFKSI